MPVEVVALSTTDRDVAYALLDPTGRSSRSPGAAAAEPFACDLRMMTTRGLGADRIRLPAVARCVLAPVDFFLAASPADGALRLAARRDEAVLRPGEVARYPTDATTVARWDEVTSTTIRLPVPVIERVAEERLGVPGPICASTG
jgi:hypothetical protein